MSNKNITNNKRKKKKMPIWSKILITLGCIILIILAAALGAFYSTFSKLDNIKIDKDNLGIVSKEELSEYDQHDKIKNIALFGVDSEDGIGRSDSIMIATVDPVHDKLKITSIMRDSYVSIDGYEYDKINHAYAFGGPELSIKTINQNFGLNIEDFVSVDFASLPKIIDIIGGMEINITAEELDAINFIIPDLNNINNTSSPLLSCSGTQLLDGIQTVAYTRIRYTSGGDYERTQRQRTVLSKLFEKALTLPVSQYPTLISQFLPLIQTTLNTNDILSLASKVITMGGGTLEQDRFPRDEYAYGDTINGIYYLTFDEAATKQQMMDYIFDDK